MKTETLAKHGTPEWKPISQTRAATIAVKYEVSCSGCWSSLGAVKTIEEAEALRAKHDATHSTSLAECCMYASGSVCACGNVLV